MAGIENSCTRSSGKFECDIMSLYGKEIVVCLKVLILLNVFRETPTSAGPNSFNKGKHGFSDNQRLWERKIKSQSEKS